ncbi:MAG: extracellular solute-binding protein [Solirubrobacteraceae bacterium]
MTTATAVLAMMLVVAACGSSSNSSSAPGGTTSSSGGVSSGSGPVNVLYAGSLTTLMNDSFGPAFNRATGYTFDGFPAGSNDLASQIKGKVRQGDVFLSAAPAVNATLQGAKNGNWVSWYAPFATTSLVIGYNPHSSFAHALQTEPWYKVIAKPGFRLGFTDPKLDPKGALTVQALDRAASAYHEPALKRIASDQSDLFPEQDLVGRLQSGQLDAGFFYTVEASAAKIPTVSLGPIKLSATYTVTVLAHAAHVAAAESFVKFLLGARGAKLLHSVGLATIATPKASGSGVPAPLQGVIKSS